MSKIEWTEKSWNPIIGCSKASPGCRNCYAERMAGRLANIQAQVGNYGHVVEWDDHPVDPRPMQQWNGKTRLVESALKIPLKRKKPTTYFVCSMGDLFHETVSFNDILEVMDVIAKCPQHTFLLLTKRAERMREFFQDWAPNPYWINGDYLPNVWLGVTAENQEQADSRIPALLELPAAVRFVSIEPMLEHVELAGEYHNYLEGWQTEMRSTGGMPMEERIETNQLDWVICGAESGPGRRSLDYKWAISLIDQCQVTEVPFFLKQVYGDGIIAPETVKIKMPSCFGKVWNQRPQP